MRANGQVKQDLSPIFGGRAVNREIDMLSAELASNRPIENNSAK